MTGRERGFLLLRSQLGDPERKPLTQAQLRDLRERVRKGPRVREARELETADLMALDYDMDFAQRVVQLLSEEAALDRYLAWGESLGCVPIAQVSDRYPVRVLSCLGGDAPGCLWAKGDLSILTGEKIALVGCRDLQIPNAQFAKQVGRFAAEQELVLVSGNARGADKVAQEACLDYGGRVISVVADELENQRYHDKILYLSEEGFDLGFSAQRALSRNRVIHCLPAAVLVAQCTYGKGGTWDGTTQNLAKGWSGVCCFSDGSRAMTELSQRGAQLLNVNDLTDLATLKPQRNLFDQ